MNLFGQFGLLSDAPYVHTARTPNHKKTILTDALAYFTMVPAMHCDLASCGSFENYVDKVGGQKMPIIVHLQGKKYPSGGSWY